MEIGILVPLILTILILLVLWRYQVQTFRKEEERLNLALTRLEGQLSYQERMFCERLQTALSENIQEDTFSNFKTLPPPIHHTDDYWQALSAWYRQEQNWTCEDCGINFARASVFSTYASC